MDNKPFYTVITIKAIHHITKKIKIYSHKVFNMIFLVTLNVIKNIKRYFSVSSKHDNLILKKFITIKAVNLPKTFYYDVERDTSC